MLTLRDDDDQPADLDWLKAGPFQSNPGGRIVQLGRANFRVAHAHDASFRWQLEGHDAFLPTRGQVRALFFALSGSDPTF